MDALSAITNVSDHRFAIMGIINVTPDSFFDGGRFHSLTKAVDHAKRLRDEGADILDIGGVSTRPGAEAVDFEQEKKRVLPVIEGIAREFSGPISIDTIDPLVASAALDYGASWVNDVSAGRQHPGMAELAAKRGCMMVLMHSRGTPLTMQTLISYTNVVAEVKSELLSAVTRFKDAGVKGERIILDPGIGFAKTAEQNITLLRHLGEFTTLGYPVCIGTSRKSFIGHLTGKNAGDRLFGTLGSVASAFTKEATIFRVHDVAATKDCLKVLSAIEYGI